MHVRKKIPLKLKKKIHRIKSLHLKMLNIKWNKKEVALKKKNKNKM